MFDRFMSILSTTVKIYCLYEVYILKKCYKNSVLIYFYFARYDLYNKSVSAGNS